MCCNSNHQSNQFCSCQENFLNRPAFWSKKKKISMLEDYLTGMQKQITEIEEAIEELKK